MQKKENVDREYEFFQLDWVFYSPAKIEFPLKIAAESKFQLPNWMEEERDCKITISEDTHSRRFKIYIAQIWWFNRGVKIVKEGDAIQRVEDCIDLANERLLELTKVFFKFQNI